MERYEIIEEVGTGGMGTVYRAIDVATGAEVALKIVRIADPADEARFQREAAALGGIDHPAVVRYLDHGSHYLVMEWLAGATLDEHLAEVGLSPAETVALVARIAAGLGAVHARGLVHRDIKPKNLMLVGGAPERATILDFGVARPAQPMGVVTHTGRTVGTPGYMSPEQTRGERALDARSDIFSLGCVLYECLAGRAAFPGEHATAVCTKILLDDPPRLAALWPEGPAALHALVDACLDKAPDRRPADGHALAARLAALPAVDPTLPRRAPFHATPTVPLGPLGRRAPTGDALVTVLVARPAAPPRGLFDAVARLGARTDTLADGTILVELTGGTVPHHAAAVATLVALLEPGIVAVATGESDRDTDVAERAAHAFEAEAIAAALPARARSPRGAARTDEPTLRLLVPPLAALRDRASYLLTRSP